LHERNLIGACGDKMGELFENFGVRVPVKRLALTLGVTFEHHILEDVHQVVDTLLVNLRVIIRVCLRMVPRTAQTCNLILCLNWIAGHVDYSESSQSEIFLPQMQLDEEMRTIVDGEIVSLLISHFSVEILAVFFDSFHQVQDLVRNELALFFRKVKLNEGVLISA